MYVHVTVVRLSVFLGAVSILVAACAAQTTPSISAAPASVTPTGSASPGSSVVRPTAFPTLGATPTLEPTPTAVATSSAGSVTLVGAGDIANCSSSGDEATAALLDQIQGTVFTLGDNAYVAGTATDFRDCYAPSWGRFKARTRPTAGNHDWLTANAQGYRDYFGFTAIPTYYSYDLGAWHVVVLDSNCPQVRGCDAGSPQYTWLAHDLAANVWPCTLAMWHHPRFSSGPNGRYPRMQSIWQLLYDQSADLVLSGHDHDYERFAPQTATGERDNARGLREFVVGTGGEQHYPFTHLQPNSEVRNNDTFGVLKLTLWWGAYDWQFIPVAGASFADAGSGVCHKARRLQR